MRRALCEGPSGLAWDAGDGTCRHSGGAFGSIAGRMLVSFAEGQCFASCLSLPICKVGLITCRAAGDAGALQRTQRRSAARSYRAVAGAACCGVVNVTRPRRVCGLRRTARRVTAWKRRGRRRGGVNAKRQVSFQGRQQLKDQNYQTKPQDHIRCQGRTHLVSPPRKGLSAQPITLMMWRREEEDLTQSEMKFSS